MNTNINAKKTPAQSLAAQAKLDKANEAWLAANALFTAPPISESAMPHVSEATYVSALASSLTSSKYALQLEMATCLSVFHDFGNIGREAKQRLMEVYNLAGYDCKDHNGSEYKTVNRRINAGALLFTHIGSDVVAQMCENGVEMMLLTNIVAALEPFNLRTIDGVLNFVGKPRKQGQSTTPQEHATNTPEGSTGTEGEDNDGYEAERHTQALMRRASDEDAPGPMSDAEAIRYEQWLAQRSETPQQHKWELANGYHHVSTENIHVSIPPDASKDEIIKAALALMALAEAMDVNSVTEDKIIERHSGQAKPIETKSTTARRIRKPVSA